METSRHKALPMLGQETEVLPQTVPSAVCLTCSVCCRFPEADSVLRPYFTSAEIDRAIEAGLPPAYFENRQGCQVTLVANASGAGYLCPAFDARSSTCRIYSARPFDCQVYPLAIMWSADGQEVLLGWDTKCPFIVGAGRGARDARALHPEVSSLEPGASSLSLESYAEELASRLESETYVERFLSNVGLIGPYQDDVQVLRPLRRLSERLRGRRVAALQPVTPDDRSVFETALSHTPTALSSYAFPPHYVWRNLFNYSSATLAGHLCLFAEQGDGLFMPLPPLALDQPLSAHSRLTGQFREAVGAAFELMQQRSGLRNGVARIEGVTEELKPELEALGYRVKPKSADYLYRTDALSALAGDRYKTQRNACNRLIREQTVHVESYRPEHREACLALYRRWALQQEAREDLDDVARQMLKDAALAHAVGLAEADALGLVGLVVFVEGTLCAYTLGYGLPAQTPGGEPVFCVLFEIADRSVPGLAQFIFRECCRYAARQGYVWINTMDDSGLPSLARAKAAYRPARLVWQYIATRPQS